MLRKLWIGLLAAAYFVFADERGQLVFDLVPPEELAGFIRSVQRDIEEAELILSNFLPNVTQNGITFAYTVGQVLANAAAKFRNWDTPAPIAKRVGMQRRAGELVPISEKIRLGEEESLRLDALRTGSNDQALIDAIYDDADNLARMVARRFELARGEILETAALTLDENGVAQTVDFGRDSDLEPTALAGTAKWSDHDNSDPITDLTDWAATWASFNNGARPQIALTSSAVIAEVQSNAKIRALSAVNQGAPQIVTVDAVNAVTAAYQLPRFLPYDVAIEVDGVETSVISPDVVILLGGPNRRPGRTVFGPTAEAVELVGARQLALEKASGLVSTILKEFDPPSTWTKVAGVGLPLLTDPNATLVVDVV